MGNKQRTKHFYKRRSLVKNLHARSRSSISKAPTTSSSPVITSKRTLSVSSKKIVKRQKTYNNSSSAADAPLDAYSIIQNQLLLSLLSKTKCELCDKQWNGKLHMNKREGLFVILSFECDYCNNKIQIDSSPQVPGSKRHDINVRAQFAGHLTGIRHAGLKKISAALNLPPPLEEGRHYKHDKELLQAIKLFTSKSMSTAVQEAVTAAKSTDLIVSGDGTWQTRGFSSKHGAASLISTCDAPKVLDIETCSKTCNVCAGAKSLLQVGTSEAAARYDQIITTHRCGKNFDQSSGNMETSCTLKMFRRSQKKYGVRYVKYVGDGDAKTFSLLKKEQPYQGIEIEKIEDINHFGKRLKRALQEIKRQCGKKKLSDGKTIGGKGRLTDQMIIRLQIYFCAAIRKNKNDLNKLYKSTQAIFWHKFSTNNDPHHEFCDIEWCGYLKARNTNTDYDHAPHGLPRAVMNKIKPVFDSICSKKSLVRVVNGSTQNANEGFHSLIWTMSPKHKASSEVTFNIACCLAVLIFNDGYYSLGAIFAKLCGFIGFYTSNILMSFDNERLHTENKEYMRKQRKLNSSRATDQDTSEEDDITASDTGNLNETSDDDNDDQSDDDTSDDENDDQSDDNNDNSDDEENDNGPNQDEEDLYYNPKSRKWRFSDEDN